jgi:YbgC/YbaW family acyl-CoA thioester hydrolase
MLTIKRRINFYNCDPAGILFYGNIFFFCHSAYEELISSFNLKINYWQNDEFVVPIIKSTADYLKPFKHGDELTIEVSATELRESSFELNYKCSNQSGDVCAEVKTVHVLIDKKTWQKKELTPELKDGLKNHLISK